MTQLGRVCFASHRVLDADPIGIDMFREGGRYLLNGTKLEVPMTNIETKCKDTSRNVEV